jgi:hypothetical protein
MKTTIRILGVALAAALLAPAAHPADAPAGGAKSAEKAAAKQRSFASPDAAAQALVDAARAKNVSDLLAIVGPGSGEWLSSGDKVADANDWARFVKAYDEKHALDNKDATHAVLDVGNDAWPFPAPIVKHGDQWAFDAKAGREEFLNRRVGRNELDAMQTLLAVVDAQREYAASDADGNGYADYAKRFLSTPGKKDGLYWPTKAGEPESPLGPLVATASREGYGKKGDGKPGAYHGYHYRLLTSQGKDAQGGAYDYMVGDKLLGGFGVVAWPANYGASGVMTFIVNHDGVVYQKDLGARTDAIASVMTRFNPDPTWRKAE